jgi:RNA polymerase sigma-70 factor (ECF subfamily)
MSHNCVVLEGSSQEYGLILRKRFWLLESGSWEGLGLAKVLQEGLVMKEKKVTDLMLVKRFCAGSMDAFEEIVARYETKVFNLAMRFCRNQEDAEEVIQDVFTTLFQKLKGFEGKSAFSSWLYRIVVNASFMKLRKRKQQNATVSLEDLTPLVRQQCMERESQSLARSDSITLSKELRDRLEDAIGKLPEEYRAVFVLRDVDGLSNEEVGEILDLSIPAVKSRLHRSRIMLRRKLSRFYEEFVGSRSSIRTEAERIMAIESEAA